MDRPSIPTDTVRAVLVEAGHRCAIPTCRATTTEIAHIEPWAKSHDNTFGNLIALCPNCHMRFDQKKEIDAKSVRIYKQNLAARGKTEEIGSLGQAALIGCASRSVTDVDAKASEPEAA